jgi:hypothetical protein
VSFDSDYHESWDIDSALHPARTEVQRLVTSASFEGFKTEALPKVS